MAPYLMRVARRGTTINNSALSHSARFIPGALPRGPPSTRAGKAQKTEQYNSSFHFPFFFHDGHGPSPPWRAMQRSSNPLLGICNSSNKKSWGDLNLGDKHGDPMSQPVSAGQGPFLHPTPGGGKHMELG